MSITTRIVLVIAVAVCVSWMIAHGLDTLLLARVRSSSDIQGDVAISDHLTLWRMAVSAFLSHPLTGVGMGGGTVIAAATGVRDWYVHNVYLQIIFELGVLGALIWGTVVCSWMWSSFRVRLGPLGGPRGRGRRRRAADRDVGAVRAAPAGSQLVPTRSARLVHRRRATAAARRGTARLARAHCGAEAA